MSGAVRTENLAPAKFDCSTLLDTVVRPKNLLRAGLLLALCGACAWAWHTADGSWADLWLTPDQQGARLLAQQRYNEAAKQFHDPLWRGVALYRDGQFQE